MENTVVTIITVCYNSADTIEETIESVLSQSYKNIEYIIIDGGSTDGTLSVINKYANRIEKITSEPDQGIYDAMNKGIKQATGEIIGILNSDDVFFTSHIITEIVEIFLNNQIDVVYGNIMMSSFSNLNKHVRKWIAGERKSFVWGWHPPHPGLFVKKQCYLSFGLYNISYNVSSDFDLMLRLFQVHHVRSFYLNKFIVNMRIGGESTGSFSKILAGNINIKKSFRSNGVTYLWFYPVIRIVKKVLQFF